MPRMMLRRSNATRPLRLATLAAAAGLLFALQAVLSQRWLARFHFGPVEWVWRALTYLRWPPLRRTHNPG